MDALAIVVAVGLLSITAYVYLQNRKYPPGPYGVPLLGYLPFFGTTIAETIFKLRNKYGNVVSVSVGTVTVVILNDWEAIKEAFVRQGEVFTGRPLAQKSHVLGNKGVLYVDGPPWKEQKRTTSHLLRQLALVQPSEKVIIEEVEKLTKYLKAQDGKPVDIVDIVTLPTLNNTLKMLFGIQLDRTDKDFLFLKKCLDANDGHEIRKDILHDSFLRKLIGKKISPEDDRLLWNRKMYEYIIRQIELHRKPSKDMGGHNDFIGMYLAEIERNRQPDGTEKEPYTLSDLTHTCYTLLIASVDSTDATLHWALLCIAHHQKVQKKIHEELDGVIAVESILTQDYKALVPYTQAVLLEVQRFVPIGMMSLPHRSLKDTVVLGHNIPKDTIVFSNQYAAHHDERYWGDPEVFRPQRFLDEQGQVVRQECLIPFSLGPRICLGESLAKTTLFLILNNILRRFSFSFVPGEPEPIIGSDQDSIVRKPFPFSLIVQHRN